jgi:hypothetical protein
MVTASTTSLEVRSTSGTGINSWLKNRLGANKLEGLCVDNLGVLAQDEADPQAEEQVRRARIKSLIDIRRTFGTN